MKKIGLFIIMALLSVSCEKTMPVAYFTTEKDIFLVGEKVMIINRSENADSYSWWAGGTVGFDFNFSPVFVTPGKHEIKLTASNGNGHSEYSKTVTIKESTSLSVIVKDASGIAVDNCTISLYSNYNDWFNETNPLEQDFTNSSGFYQFININIESKTYYISAVKQIENNYLTNWDVSKPENFTITTRQYSENKIDITVLPYYKKGMETQNTIFKNNLYYSVQ